MGLDKSNTFKAIADPLRRDIIELLAKQSPLTINQVSNQFAISRQGITKHLKILESSGLVSIASQGRNQVCTFNPEPLKSVAEWLAEYEIFWGQALTRLKYHLNDSSTTKQK